MTEFLIKSILTEELFENKICESLEDKEIVDFFYKEFLCERFLYGEPVSVPELRKLLRTKILNFEFIKLDGEVRKAKGTTMLRYIPVEDHPKGIRPSSPKVATFFDLDKDAWRSVSQRSKEIVLKKDEEKNRPIVVVKDIDREVDKEKGKTVEKPMKPQVKPITKHAEEEPGEDLQVGDVRNYLNRRDENIEIEIIRLDPDGGIYARTIRDGAVFKIPESRIRNIGEIVEHPNYRMPGVKPILRRPITKPAPKEPEKPEETTILLPIKQAPSKEPPKEIQEEPGAEELEQ
jgi:hypothetical protein